jgi:ferredoxin
VEVLVDGVAVTVPDGVTILEACDLAGRYVPRLCSYPGIGCGCELGVSCGLCVVVLDDGASSVEHVLACSTRARSGVRVTTSGAALHAERLKRLARILECHPHTCLTCPDRDGCTREECTSGTPVEARCCEEFGRCEIGRLIAYVDPRTELPRRGVSVSRSSCQEGRIRREPGLCVGCGRCVVVCNGSPAAGKALELERSCGPESDEPDGRRSGDPGPQAHERRRAAPKKETLRASGCTFCGQCVMVCPSGAVTAPGEAGTRWLEGWRRRTGLASSVLPPEAGWRRISEDELAQVPVRPGVFHLADAAGSVLRISGVADLAHGIRAALTEPACASATHFQVEAAELFTERESELLARFAQEHAHLPPGNDLGDDLFADDLFADGSFDEEAE